MARKPSPSHTRPCSREKAIAPPRQNRMLRFLVLFPIFLAAGFCALLIPFLHPVITGFTRGLVEVSAIVIRLFGGHAAAQQVILRNPSNGFAMEVLDGCNGDDVAVLLWAAILAYPASWLQKGKGPAGRHGDDLRHQLSAHHQPFLPGPIRQAVVRVRAPLCMGERVCASHADHLLDVGAAHVSAVSAALDKSKVIV